MDQLNDMSVVEQQYATATNLQTRISIHDKYSTNKMGFGNWIFSNYKIAPRNARFGIRLRDGRYVEKQRRFDPSVFQADSFRFFKSDDRSCQKQYR